jgi:tetratricopeptide (TPR) repeat protein
MVAGVVVAGVWLAVATRSNSQAKPKAAQSGQAAGAGAKASTRLRWRSPYPELRVELLSSNGKVLARSGPARSTGEVKLRPGVYVLRAADRHGLWPGAVKRFEVGAYQVLTITPSPEVLAHYYFWLGKRLLKKERSRDEAVERAWRRAIKMKPRSVDTRLHLAAFLTLRGRYNEARGQLRKALDVAPRDERVIHLLNSIDQLEAAQ